MNETALPDALTYLRYGLAGAGLLLVLTAAVIDIRKFIIPNWLNGALMALGLAFAIVSSFTPARFEWVTHIAVFVLFFAVGTLMFGMGWLGGGDVKLMAVLAFWAGTSLIVGFLIYTAAAGGVLSAVYLIKAWIRARKATVSKDDAAKDAPPGLMREPVPYGVAIAAGGVYVFARITGHLG